jgi:ATP-dependent Clp protease adaptor protein ClpS
MTSSSSPTCEKPAPKTESLPPWKLILHNDNVNTAEHVAIKVQEILKIEEEKAAELVIEAHETGTALLMLTHQEKAELYVEMFQSCKITVTAEKA